MKSFCLSILAISLYCLPAHAAEVGKAMAPYDFAQVAIMKRIEELSKEGRYSKIYSALDPEYTNGITEAAFIGALNKTSWRIEHVHAGTLEQYAAISYMPVTGEVIRRGRLPLSIDVVVFFKRTKTGWRLLNFPFMPPDLPSFTSIPDWFLGRVFKIDGTSWTAP